MFKGSFVAIVTPFRDGKLDEAALRSLLEFHLSNGTNGIVPCGTTGESPTLSHDEYERVIDITVEMVHGRLPVIAGTGFNATDKTIEATRFAKKAGADGALIVTPYYNRPTPEGLYQHFAAVAKTVDIPIIVYNIPGRTGTNILPDTMARLASIETIVGVKESTGSLQQVQEMIKLCGDKFTVLSGDDWATLPLLAVGGPPPGLADRVLERVRAERRLEVVEEEPEEERGRPAEAEVVGVPASTMRSRVARAKQRLAEEIGGPETGVSG